MYLLNWNVPQTVTIIACTLHNYTVILDYKESFFVEENVAVIIA